jgi:uncharacterized protein
VLSWSWTFPFAAIGDVIEKGKGRPTHEPAVFGPALAAFTVTAWLCGRRGVAELIVRIGGWRMPVRWWAATLSPLWFLAVALVIAAAAGKLPRFSDFGRYSGLPTIGVGAVAVGNLRRLRRGGRLARVRVAGPAAMTPIWAVWHLPFFFTVATYRNFPCGLRRLRVRPRVRLGHPRLAV